MTDEIEPPTRDGTRNLLMRLRDWNDRESRANELPDVAVLALRLETFAELTADRPTTVLSFLRRPVPRPDPSPFWRRETIPGFLVAEYEFQDLGGHADHGIHGPQLDPTMRLSSVDPRVRGVIAGTGLEIARQFEDDYVLGVRFPIASVGSEVAFALGVALQVTSQPHKQSVLARAAALTSLTDTLGVHLEHDAATTGLVLRRMGSAAGARDVYDTMLRVDDAVGAALSSRSSAARSTIAAVRSLMQLDRGIAVDATRGLA